MMFCSNNSTLWASVQQSNCLIIPEKMAELWIFLFVNNISSSECNCEYSTVETQCFFDGCVNSQCHLLTISYMPETLLVVVGRLDTQSCPILVTYGL